MLEKEIIILDLETTGLTSYPNSIPVEIAVYKIKKNLEVEHILDSFIQWPACDEQRINDSWWSDMSGIKYKDTIGSSGIKGIWTELKCILDNKKVTSWNTSYDFGLFIRPLEIIFGKLNYELLPCPMKTSADIVKVSYNDWYHSWKWPTLGEAAEYYGIHLDPDGYGFHRADYDTHMTALIVAEMIRRKEFL